jgi:hypothetical protein
VAPEGGVSEAPAAEVEERRDEDGDHRRPLHRLVLGRRGLQGVLNYKRLLSTRTTELLVICEI